MKLERDRTNQRTSSRTTAPTEYTTSGTRFSPPDARDAGDFLGPVLQALADRRVVLA